MPKTPVNPKNKVTLGEMLIDEGLLGQKQYDIALREQRRSGDRLEKVLVDMNFVAEDVVSQFSAKRLGIPFVDLDGQLITGDIVKLIPEAVARKHSAVSFASEANILSVAMTDPLNVFAVDDIERSSRMRVRIFISNAAGVKKIQDTYYGISETVDELLKKMDERSLQTVQGEEVQVERLRRVAIETPVVMLVNLILAKAIRRKSSDIHFEPLADDLRIRMRIDGILHEDSILPKKLQPAVISRLKIMGEIDIGERRVPQDGHVQLRIENREIDLRLATLPTIYGEKLVIRILDKRGFAMNFNQLGFSERMVRLLPQILDKPQGLILVTGPTGCGKTTTLYSAMQKLNQPAKNISTVEDPVEYRIANITQTQINLKAGMTFAKCLRGIMRQDPDVIMVGEIRDTETAEIAVRASLTGHMVLSTLHTNDAVGALDRLADMGIERYLIGSSLTGIIAQRLVRVLCPKCKKPARVKDKIAEMKIPDNAKIFESAGCPECNNTGFSGRMGIYEILDITPEIQRAIIDRISSIEIKKIAAEQGMETMRQDGIAKVFNGTTTYSEVLRVIGGDE